MILAAISIQALTNTGIFAQANNAKRESEIANIKEKIALDIYEKQLEPPLGSITEEQLETILSKYGTVNKEDDGTIIGITTDKGYAILLSEIYSGGTTAGTETESVPDGAVVTPVNDITTWLKTGGISNQYSYTTIEQVIADSTCTQSLMNNENAMKYLARSTEFADAICASKTTMTYLGQSAYVDNTVLNSDIWVETISNSVYMYNVLTDLVPSMTGYTSPSGRCYASNEYDSSKVAWHLYDKKFTPNVDLTGWSFNANVDLQRWNAYEFDSAVRVIMCRVVGWNNLTWTPASFNIEASNDGENWIILLNNATSPRNTTFIPVDYVIQNKNKYKYYRYHVTGIGGGVDCATSELMYYGRP